ncbi:TadE/TadG family type IV pilus assembly protein [Saccharopolyspora sp. ID03-671]|uniref:TadE/TadG family type IV pilus assembly protein n=1 Tax=Saccharopolyspora sp. ID03-671 TaxID=3073066 RepID=UPI0032442A56
MTARLARRFRASIRRFRRDERGAVTAELVLAVPALLLLILLIAQFAIWAHATHIAQAAASQALSAARVQGASSTDGHAEAAAVLNQLGAGPLKNPHAIVNRGPEQSTVEITGQAAPVVPFLDLPVRGRAAGPSERFVVPGGNG